MHGWIRAGMHGICNQSQCACANEHKRLQTGCILVSFFYKCEIAELLCDFYRIIANLQQLCHYLSLHTASTLNVSA